MWAFVLVLGVLAWCTQAAPSKTHSPAPSAATPGVKFPILWNRDQLHPRNKNLEGEGLLRWMRNERGHLHVKYAPKNSTKGRRLRARQAAPLGNAQQGGFYFTQIGIGTPARTLNVVLDTGSSDFWLADTSCSSCQNMALYDPSKSSSFKDSDRKFQLQYGQGAVQGKLGAENVSMAGYRVENLSFGRTQKLAKGTIQHPASGLMGMAFESLSGTGTTPLWQVVSIQGKVKDPVFSFQLIDDKSGPGGFQQVTPGGVFTLGNLDDQQYSGEIAWVDVDDKYGSEGLGYWGIKMDKLQVNGKDVSLDKDNMVVVDTGTTLIGGPESIVKALYEHIPDAQPAPANMFGGDGYYVFPCSQSFEMKFTFGGKTFTLNDKQLNIGKVDPGKNLCGSALFVSPTPSGSQMPSWILGDSFLSNVFSVFSWDPERVGFAAPPSNGPKTLPLTSTSANKDKPKATGNQDGGGGGISEISRSPVMHATGIVGGNGLPTPSLVSAPKGMQTLGTKGYEPNDDKGGGVGGLGQATTILVTNSKQLASITSQLGDGAQVNSIFSQFGDGGGIFSIGNTGSSVVRTGRLDLMLLSGAAALLAACLAL